MNLQKRRLRLLKRITPKPVTKYVGHQSWTADNLCVDSEHNDIHYNTTRWDALCPYIDVTEDMLANAPKPLIIYALPPDGPFGVPINDRYGLVDVSQQAFWEEERRARKFKELDKLCKSFVCTEYVVPGKDLTVEDLFEMGGDHFATYYIDDREVEGFVDYIRDLDVLILQAHTPEGDLILTDVSILLPDYQQVYGSFCACLMACRWAAKNGYRYYNLGPVDDYGYKALFVTDFEPIYAIGLSDPDHPLALDPTSPLNTDFKPEQLNQIYRPDTLKKMANSA